MSAFSNLRQYQEGFAERLHPIGVSSFCLWKRQTQQSGNCISAIKLQKWPNGVNWNTFRPGEVQAVKCLTSI
ncbi:hypothetical protein AMECASPLE_028391 [Ameca splendens]|uniref:Uncharacterized protein n=1 Tax=Ameca splendens TaxID=208324 RepID=A0ABV0ZEB3_9TELE